MDLAPVRLLPKYVNVRGLALSDRPGFDCNYMNGRRPVAVQGLFADTRGLDFELSWSDQSYCPLRVPLYYYYLQIARLLS